MTGIINPAAKFRTCRGWKDRRRTCELSARTEDQGPTAIGIASLCVILTNFFFRKANSHTW